MQDERGVVPNSTVMVVGVVPNSTVMVVGHTNLGDAEGRLILRVHGADRQAKRQLAVTLS